MTTCRRYSTLIINVSTSKKDDRCRREGTLYRAHRTEMIDKREMYARFLEQSGCAHEPVSASALIETRFFFRRKNQSLDQQRQQQFSVNGTLKLVNTIEEFKTFDIDAALKAESSVVSTPRQSANR